MGQITDILKGFATGVFNAPSNLVSSIPAGLKGVYEFINANADPDQKALLWEAIGKMSPKEKQAVADSFMEMAGAAGGATAGGLFGGPPGAMAGAGGGGMTMKGLSRLIGSYVNPEAFKDSTAPKEAEILGDSLAGNGLMEGGLSGLLNASRAAKVKLFKPTTGAATLSAKAKSLPVPVPQTLGVETGRPWIQQMEAALANHGFTAGTMEKAKAAAQAAFEKNLNIFMERYHGSEVTPEMFQAAAERAMSDARNTFQSGLQTKVDASVGRFGRRKTAVQAGDDLYKAHLNNEQMLKDWANRAYPDVFKRADAANVVVDTTKLGSEASDILGKVPDDIKSLVLNPAARKTLRDAERLRPEYIEDSPVPGGVERIRVDVHPDTGEMAPQLTLQQARDLKKALREHSRTLANPEDRMNVRRLADILDAEMQSAIKSSGDVDLVNAWRATEGKFAKGAQAVRKSAKRTNPNGNPMAKKIEAIGKDEPEKLVPQATDNASRIADTELATDPDTITRITDPDLNTVPGRPAMDSARRVEADSIIDNSVDKKGRISPSDIHGSFMDPRNMERFRALFGGRLDDLVTDMGNATGREANLYDSKLAKTLDRVDHKSTDVLNAGLPDHNAPTSEATLDLLGPDRGIGQRAFAEKMVDQSSKTGVRNRPLGDVTNPHVDPFQLERSVNNSGETARAVLGQSGVDDVHNIVDVGKANFAPDLLYGNSSRTAPMRELFRIGRDIITAPVHPLRALKTTAAAGVANAAATATTSPRFINWAIGGPRIPRPGVTGKLIDTSLDIATIPGHHPAGTARVLSAIGKATTPERGDDIAAVDDDTPIRAEDDDTPIRAEDDGPAVPAGKLRR